VEQLARVATLVERARTETAHPVIYVDAGDAEETTNRLSNLTRGVAMIELLSAAGCEAACVGNAVWLRYGFQALAEEAEAAGFPLLLANLAPVGGVRPTALIDGVGFVGVTDAFRDFLEGFDFGIQPLDEIEVVRRHARELREQGAGLVVVLSHLGLGEMHDRRGPRVDDRELASALQGEIDLIVGGHSHDLLPQGEWIGNVLAAHAGAYGEYLGRIDIDGRERRASLIRVSEDVPPHPRVLEEAARVEAALEASLDEVLAELDEPLGPQWIAEMLRRRMSADVALITAGAALERTLPAGPLRRGELWEACHSTGNPGVAELTGAQLREAIERGNDPAFQETTAGPLRGKPRGRLHVAGANHIDTSRVYTVAGTDWELEPYGGMVEASWGARTRYDFPTILREAIEEDLGCERR
jgi:2',3'-cyclic-nucleotide 2'-phosphodiesterase (5'-nucleotidase family)